MDAYRLHLKLYFEPEAEVDPSLFIPIFHRWIRDRELDELLIDVADYIQVPSGPGVMLIAHEAHYSIDSTDGRPGLLYARKRPQSGPFDERLRQAWRRLLAAARALEREPTLEGRLQIPGDRLAFRIHDRLLAPNSRETFAAVEPQLRQVLHDLYRDTELTLEHEDDAGACFGIQVRAAARPGIEGLSVAA